MPNRSFEANNVNPTLGQFAVPVNLNNTYRTGERVPESGVFQSVTGRKMQYREGELFQACSSSGEDTNWTKCDSDPT